MSGLVPNDLFSLLRATLASLILYWLYLIVYRLYFAPEAKFPGPKLAAVTYLYEFYHDRLFAGRYVFKVQELHKQYGPVVRVSPHEIHINDPAFLSTLYTTGKAIRDKDPYHLPPDHTLSTFDSIGHHTHRLRRSVLNRFFSAASVNKVEPMIRSLANKMTAKLRAYEAAPGTVAQPVDIANVFRCIVSDVIWLYSLGFNASYLDHNDFKPSLALDVLTLAWVVPLLRQLPFLPKLRYITNDAFVGWLVPRAAPILAWRRSVGDAVTRVNTEVDQARRAGFVPKADTDCPTIFHEILYDNELPPEEKAIPRMIEEAESLVGAGSVSTAWALLLTVGHLLLPESAPVLDKIVAELTTLMPNPEDECPPVAVLENNAPYLSAAVSEGLRMALGTGQRLARKAPEETLRYTHKETGETVLIPPNVAVSMTALAVNYNEDNFPQPFSFRPARWLDEQGKKRKNLESYILSFGKGTRNCVGMNLAYAEMYIIIAVLFRQMGNRMTLFESGPSDFTPCRVFNTPAPSYDSKGVMVTIQANGLVI